MPANLSPEYKAAEAAYRAAREPRERLDGLREMLRTIPKHKGTEHLQADIKARIKDLTGELGGPRKAGAHAGPALVIRPEGAAQVALLGPPNSGKSALHARLTGSEAHVAPYPFTTQWPMPGMLPYEDVQFQLVDLPAIASEHPAPWLASTLQMADAALLVVDVSDAACVEQVGAVRVILRGMRVTLAGGAEGDAGDRGAPAGKRDAKGREPAADAPGPHASREDEAGLDDPFAIVLPTLMLANHADALADPSADVAALRELTGASWPVLATSATTGLGLGEIARWLFGALRIVRVYTKVPGHPADRQRPFTLRGGGTVADVARLVHRDLVRTLRYARLWGASGFDGQQVGPEHRVADGDVVELHA